MIVEPLSVVCECGRPSSTFIHIGLSQDHHLVLEWQCDVCRQTMCALKTLSDCWRECPPDQNVPGSQLASPAQIEADDIAFLGRMGIKYACQ